MKWEDFRQSDHVEDLRGQGGGDGGGLSIPMGGGGGLGMGMIIILGLIGYFLGIDPRILIGGAEIITGGGGSGYSQPAPQQRLPSPQANRQQPPASDQIGRFVSAIVAMNEDVWTEQLPAQKRVRYEPPTLRIFENVTRSGCGVAQSQMGPFYCPVDRTVYLDTSFFNEMKRKLGGGGDFAYAYVIAHEIGHHIENLLGILPKVQAAQERASTKAEANGYSVRVELMADCLAGVWAAHANQKWKILEDGDIEKAIATAQAIGDDRLQSAARGYAMPDSFTHGSSAQRVAWLKRGLQSGSVDACNTFSQ